MPFEHVFCPSTILINLFLVCVVVSQFLLLYYFHVYVLKLGLCVYVCVSDMCVTVTVSVGVTFCACVPVSVTVHLSVEKHKPLILLLLSWYSKFRIAHLVELQTCDGEIVNLNLRRSGPGRRIFFSRVNFLC